MGFSTASVGFPPPRRLAVNFNMLPLGPIAATGSGQSNDDEGARRELFAQWATSAYRAGSETSAEPVATAARLPPQEFAASVPAPPLAVPDPDGRSSLVVQLEARAAALQEQEHRVHTTFGSPLTGRHLRDATQGLQPGGSATGLQLPPSLSLQLPSSVQPQPQLQPQRLQKLPQPQL